MSSKRKKKKKKSSQRPPLTSIAAAQIAGAQQGKTASLAKHEALDAVGKKIKGYIARGQSKIALQTAKQYHKDSNSNASESLLIEAYLARIDTISKQGNAEDAKTLLNMVKHKFSLPEATFQPIAMAITFHSGKLEDILAPLALPNTPPATQAAVEAFIRQEVIDLDALARCKTLPDNHSLKVEAKELNRVFVMVTTGLVEEKDLFLNSISHRSPLAPWKMLIRALAHFYRHEDEMCAKYLNAIAPKAAPSRLVPLIQAMLTDQKIDTLSPEANRLVETVTGNIPDVRGALRNIENVMDGPPHLPPRKRKVLKNAIAVCKKHCPELVEPLKQHISTKGWLNDFEAEEIIDAVGGPSLKNANFWRLLARAAEKKNRPIWAVTLWHEFKMHAVYEGWFADQSQESAILYLHMAGLLDRLSGYELEAKRQSAPRLAKHIKNQYFKQPPSVLKVVESNSKTHHTTFFLYPERLYQKALDIAPSADTYKRYLKYIRTNTSGWKKTDEVSIRWHEAIPDDPQPLLNLMRSAEKRNAFNKALGYLEKAEQMDGLNTTVKQARLRLLTAITLRHLKQNKPHLAKKDFNQLELLPQLKEGDRSAFLVALRAICALLEHNQTEFLSLNQKLNDHFESELTAKMIMDGLTKICGVAVQMNHTISSTGMGLSDQPLVEAIAKGLILSEDMGITVPFPRQFNDRLQSALSSAELTTPPTLLKSIAEKALRENIPEITYEAAGAGLSQATPSVADFLFLRAKSIPNRRSQRSKNCLTAALELARRQRQINLVDEIIEYQREINPFQSLFLPFDTTLPQKPGTISDEEVQQTIEREKSSRADYSSSYEPEADLDSGVDDLFEDDTPEDCKYCEELDCPNRKAPYIGEDCDDDDSWDMPPKHLLPLIEKLFKNRGKRGRKSPLDELLDMDPALLKEMLEMIPIDDDDDDVDDWLDEMNFKPKSRKKKKRR